MKRYGRSQRRQTSRFQMLNLQSILYSGKKKRNHLEPLLLQLDSSHSLVSFSLTGTLTSTSAIAALQYIRDVPPSHPATPPYLDNRDAEAHPRDSRGGASRQRVQKLMLRFVL